ncbi:subtilisin-like protease SBT1.8 [Canna indica]|uniref:Subtilisin-like protease SBT1.8 n=1 Tax=Canna indica TaxID=4628 RepID=A0AAQ3KY81_9LILI|nr:subtilisin-like protease SBT1.8 [Canna indica]
MAKGCSFAVLGLLCLRRRLGFLQSDLHCAQEPRLSALGSPYPCRLVHGPSPVDVHRPLASPPLAYSDILHGFVAALLPYHLPMLRSSYDVLDLYPDPIYELHTTRSPQFLGLALDAGVASSATTLPRPIQAIEAASHDVFIIVLDTSVWPKIPSFSDAGLPEVPSRGFEPDIQPDVES